MTPERHHHIGKIYREALEKDPSHRPAYLEKACAGDESLRSEVESLLLYQARDGGFIDQPILERVIRAIGGDATLGENKTLIGQSIGDYRVISLLGEGGMGEVYLCDDLPLNRRVAIKLLPAG